MRVVVIGAGPAGIIAALRSAQLGAQTTLLSRGPFGGMAANDGPVPVRVLAHAARLARDSRQLAQYGISTGRPDLDYTRLLARVQEVVANIRTHEALRPNLERAGVSVYEHTGVVRFVGPKRRWTTPASGSRHPVHRWDESTIANSGFRVYRHAQ